MIPLFASYAVACGAFESKRWSEHAASSVEVTRDADGAPLDPAVSSSASRAGTRWTAATTRSSHGDPLLFEWIERGSARDYVDQRVLVEHASRGGTAAALKLLAPRRPGYRLDSANPAYPPIEGQRDMAVAARLVRRLAQDDINPLASESANASNARTCPPLYGLEYNPGNWQSRPCLDSAARRPLRHA